MPTSDLASAWDDIYDVFGNGDDYDWALEGEEEMMGGQVEGEQPKMEDVSSNTISPG